MTRTLTVLALALVLGACNSSPLRGVGDWFADARELEGVAANAPRRGAPTAGG